MSAAATLRRVTTPSGEIVSVDALKRHLREFSTTRDDDIGELAQVAIEQVQSDLRRQLLTATFDWSLPGFPAEPLALPLAPVVSITSVKYRDSAGTLQTLDPAFYTLVAGEPAVLTPALNQDWPEVANVPDAVQIRFEAGYGSTAESVPHVARQLIKLLVEGGYSGNEEGIRSAYENLLRRLDWRHT